MKKDYVKKGLVIGVIVLFVCVGISSAVAIKEVNANNNDVINSSNVVSTEDLPDLIVVNIDAIPYGGDEYYIAWVTIKNIGNTSIEGLVTISIGVYRGLSNRHNIGNIGPSAIWLNLAPGIEKEFEFMSRYPDNIFYFFNIVAYVNYDKKVEESNYSNNAARQNFYQIYYPPNWYKIGPITYYPLLVPHQLGI